MENLSKEKQIEEMAKAVNERINKSTTMTKVYEALYDAGYRKQSEPFSCGHEKGSEWISVEERLPEDDEYVIAVATCVPKLNIKFVNAVVATPFFEEEGFIDIEIDEVLEGVTHWMPFPEAPKMKGGEADA